MTVVNIIARFIVFTLIGWIVGLLLTRVMFQIRNYRLKRKTKRAEKNFNRPFATQ